MSQKKEEFLGKLLHLKEPAYAVKFRKPHIEFIGTLKYVMLSNKPDP